MKRASTLGGAKVFARGIGKGAFTLLELLAVIGILAVLASILLPALSQGKSAARRVQCLGQLRQLGQAAAMYWDDHQGRAFRYRGVQTNGGRVYWFGWIENAAPGNEGTRAYDPAFGALYPYVGDSGVARCPSLDYYDLRFKYKGDRETYGYGYNLHLGPPTGPEVNVALLSEPSATALFADAAQVNDYQWPATSDHPMLEEFYYVSRDEATAHFRHGNAANVGMADGHVEMAEAAEGTVDVRMPEAGVGRLGEGYFAEP